MSRSTERLGQSARSADSPICDGCGEYTDECACPGPDPRAPVLRDKMMPPEWYDSLDEGIRFAVKVLHSNGFETCQSCQGGAGHAYPAPTVDLLGGAHEVPGFAALHYLEAYGLEVVSVAEVWNVSRGRVHEVIWRIELRKAWPDRADEWPMFVWGYRSQT